MSELSLGLDLGTQTLKAVLIDRSLVVLRHTAVQFDKELPEFGTTDGVHRHMDCMTVTAPPQMWVAALDLLLERMRQEGWPLVQIAAISGSAQQHGSVWLGCGTRQVLQRLQPARTLFSQLAACFSLSESPVWMDTSTTNQCLSLEKALGGAEETARLTGSRAYERFTGNQIAKIWQQQPHVYEATERIALVSSFLASLFWGDYAPIDMSDGSGMNLLDIWHKCWIPRALEHTAPRLAERLGTPVFSHTSLGRVHPYYCERYGIPADARVIAFSGDNPNSLAGLRLARPGEIAVSLGTSDTLFGPLTDPKPSGIEGHVFVNPIDPEAYMAMVVRKNGSLAREFVRDRYAGGSWERFSALLDKTPSGNEGWITLYLLEPEITPPTDHIGLFYVDRNCNHAKEVTPEVAVRGVVESQFLSLRIHAARLGLKPHKIRATGGASQNRALVKVLADVFGVPVEIGAYADSAALGAAYRALHGWLCEREGRFVPFAQIAANVEPSFETQLPDLSAHHVYEGMLERFEDLEGIICT
ncbi:MAG: xylulokinase [Kiritimatiellia bacterium]